MLGLRALLTALLLAFALLVGGCASPDAAVRITTWTLVAESGTRSEVTLPAHLEDHLASRPDAYRLETDVDLPPDLRGRDLVLAFPEFLARPTLDVNGVAAPALDAALLDRHRSADLLRFHIGRDLTRSGRLHLTLSVPNAWTHSAWVDGVPLLAAADGAGLRSPIAIDAFNRTAAAIAIVTVFLVGLLYGLLAVSVQGARRRTFAFFALAAATNLAYPALVLGLTQPILGVEEISITAAIIVLGTVIEVYATRQYFQLPRPSPTWLAWVGICALASLVFREPSYSPRWIGTVVVLSTFANATAQGLLILRLQKQGPPPENLYVIGLAWPAVAALAVPDFVVWMGGGAVFQGVETACIGIGSIAVLQAVALLRDHIRSLGEGDRLNAELGARLVALETKQREVERLNDDLRRQIAARSGQLADSLAKADRPLASSDHRLATGAVVEGRYRVVRELGTGGMGEVLEVERLADATHFAMKVLREVGDSRDQARFAREAQIAANLKHPNVVSVVDFDVARAGYIFLVMELVAGTTLRDLKGPAVGLERVLHILGQMCEGLAAIHARGIVHRDLKPANVLVSFPEEGTLPSVKITDFGVSSLLSEGTPASFTSARTRPDDDLLPLAQHTETVTFDDRRHRGEDPSYRNLGETTARQRFEVTRTAPAENHTLTRPGSLVGTPLYMAPELVYEKATASADMFSLGIIAFQLLTGCRPFAECVLHAAMMGRTLDPPPPLYTLVPGISEELAILFDRTLLYDPQGRPSARELADAIARRAVSTSTERRAGP